MLECGSTWPEAYDCRHSAIFLQRKRASFFYAVWINSGLSFVASQLWRGSLLPLGREAAPKMGLLRTPAGQAPSPRVSDCQLERLTGWHYVGWVVLTQLRAAIRTCVLRQQIGRILIATRPPVVRSILIHQALQLRVSNPEHLSLIHI